MKLKNKQPQEEEIIEEMPEVDEEQMEEEFEEHEEEVQRARQAQPKKKSSQPVQRRFQAYSQQAVEGVVDLSQNKLVATNVWEMLALIWDKLNVIESRLGDMTQ